MADSVRRLGEDLTKEPEEYFVAEDSRDPHTNILDRPHKNATRYFEKFDRNAELPFKSRSKSRPRFANSPSRGSQDRQERGKKNSSRGVIHREKISQEKVSNRVESKEPRRKSRDFSRENEGREL